MGGEDVSDDLHLDHGTPSSVCRHDGEDDVDGGDDKGPERGQRGGVEATKSGYHGKRHSTREGQRRKSRARHRRDEPKSRKGDLGLGQTFEEYFEGLFP